MDFKLKYLKYKQKYLSMKKMIGGSGTILVPLKLAGGNTHDVDNGNYDEDKFDEGLTKK